jgi:hypothetical protein
MENWANNPKPFFFLWKSNRMIGVTSRWAGIMFLGEV